MNPKKKKVPRKKREISQKKNLNGLENLWNHQTDAINFIKNYYRDFKKGHTKGAALVHMPTGSGKTGVIAAASRCLPNIGAVLVLSPRVALRKQLYQDVQSDFFLKIKWDDISTIPKHVYAPATVKEAEEIEIDDSSVLITTIQHLHQASKEDSRYLTKIKKKVNLLIVDEGHCEPAHSWSKTIRDLKKPKVIFSATPYRNDLKIFDVDSSYIFNFTFSNANSKKYVRDVKFHLQSQNPSIPDFVTSTLDFYKNFESEFELSKAPRVIIRCDSQSNIRAICQHLKQHGQKCVGIHENFRSNSRYPEEHQSVPDPKTTEATFWIHQFKLLEGIDDPRFQILAIFDELKSARSLVQQVGRIVRNQNHKIKSTAHVLDFSGGKQKRLWDAYLEFDNKVTNITDAGDYEKLKSLMDGFVNQWNLIGPDFGYFEGMFRRKFSLCDRFSPQEDLLLPLSTNVFEDRRHDLMEVASIIGSELEKMEVPSVHFLTEGGELVFLYQTVKNSPYLSKTFYVESKLGVSVINKHKSNIFVFDNLGSVLRIAPLFSGSLMPSVLKKAFVKSKTGRITDVALRSSMIGTHYLRARTLSGYSIDKVIPTLEDPNFICSTATGYSKRPTPKRNRKDYVRRYAGFNTGKITDEARVQSTFEEYIDWTQEISMLLSIKGTPASVLKRYAPESPMPSSAHPESILLDIDEDTIVRYVSSGYRNLTKGHPIEIDDACQSIRNGEFCLRVNDVQCSVKIEFRSPRYYLSSPDLENICIQADSSFDSESLVALLNRTQSFRIIPRTEGYCYSHGHFYRPGVNFGSEPSANVKHILDCLVPIPKLKEMYSEKGKKCSPKGLNWDRDSLFYLIDKKGCGTAMQESFGSPDLMICDDMNTESADFIFVEKRKRKVVFIHAKALSKKRGAKVSATKMQEGRLAQDSVSQEF